MPDSIEDLLKRTDDQLRTSAELRIATAKVIYQSKTVLALTRETIFRSRQQIARMGEGRVAEGYPLQLPGPRNR